MSHYTHILLKRRIPLRLCHVRSVCAHSVYIRRTKPPSAIDHALYVMVNRNSSSCFCQIIHLTVVYNSRKSSLKLKLLNACVGYCTDMFEPCLHDLVDIYVSVFSCIFFRVLGTRYSFFKPC